MTITNNIITTFNSLMDHTQKVVIVSHKNPDGDSLGSSLAIYHFLKDYYSVEVEVIIPNNYPDFLTWLPNTSDITIYEEQKIKANTTLKNADLVFILDCNNFDRLGNMEGVFKEISPKYIIIDHHQNPSEFANLLISNTNEISTTQIIYQLFRALQPQKELSISIATCLYTGIMTDSGSFRFPRTTSKTHRIIAELIEYGADNISIHNNISGNYSLSKIALLGVALSNLTILEEYKTAFITLSKKEMENNGYKKGDTEGFVNYALSIKGIKFAVIFTESMQESFIKISFRSKGSFDVNAFAKSYFQGGGHTNAAGGKSDKSLDETTKMFIKLLENHKQELCNY